MIMRISAGAASLAVVLLACSVGPALADDTATGVIGADYGHLEPSTGSNGDQWGLGGGLNYKLTPNFSLEGSIGYYRISGGGSDADSWNVRLDGIFGSGGWKLGPSLGYEKDSTSGVDIEVKSWGGFVDYNVPPAGAKAWGWRFHAQGGGFDTNVPVDGSYWGAGLTAYPCPKFAASATVDYTRYSGGGLSAHQTDYGIKGEYLIGDSPFSVWGGYTRSDFGPGGGFHVDSLGLGVNYHFNGPGAPSLQERHDTGPLPYNPTYTGLLFKF